MQLLQLQYFQAVAETQNMTAAAEKLHITQPSLSKVIRRLEEELGVQLFDRHASRLELNPYGGAFLVYVNQALDSLDRGEKCLEAMKASNEDSLRLICTFMGYPTLLTEQFSIKHPGFTILEHYDEPQNVIPMMLSGHMDFALTLFPVEHPEIEQLASVTEPLLLEVPESMEPPVSPVNLADYAGARFAIFEGGKDMNSTFLSCCSQANFVPNIVYRTTRSEIVHKLVNQLEVCTLIPSHMLLSHWDILPESMRTRVHLIDQPMCYRRLYLSCRRGFNHITAAQKLFEEFAMNQLNQLHREITDLVSKYQAGQSS